MLNVARSALARVALAVALVAALAALATSAALAAAPSSIAVGVGTSATLGQILVGPNGHTLYTLSSDPNNSSTCSGQCAVAWPPLLVASGGSVTGPSGMSGFGTFNRADGTTQVAVNGRALYYFIQDTAAGQTNGEGVVAFGGTWHVVKAAVAAASTGASASAMASASPSGSSVVAGATSTAGTASLAPTSTEPAGSGSGPSPWLPIALLLASLGAAVSIAIVRARTTRR